MRAPIPIPISSATYIVDIALPLLSGSLKSIVQANIVGEFIPAAAPSKAAAIKNCAWVVEMPTNHIDTTIKRVENFKTGIRP